MYIFLIYFLIALWSQGLARQNNFESVACCYWCFELSCSEAAAAKLQFGGSDTHRAESEVPHEAVCLLNLWRSVNEEEPSISWETAYVVEEGAWGRKW